ncbi:riboflavin kinase [Candidatus Uhrbacteria bacterium]|nr:riboflavin kinase [Candidatus Uhrbacteria bacterium]
MTDYLPFTIHGTIVRGSRQATRLGFPTANLDSLPDAPLSHGVYTGTATCQPFFIETPCIVFYGKPYTLDTNTDIRFEAHIINVSLPDLYGKTMTVTLANYIRPNQQFINVDELQKAIKKDITCSLASYKALA